MFISTSGRFPLVGANANNRRGKVGDNENTSEVAHLKSQFSTWFFQAIGENMLGKGIGASVNVGCFNLISLLSYLLFTVYGNSFLLFPTPSFSPIQRAPRIHTFLFFLHIFEYCQFVTPKKKKLRPPTDFVFFISIAVDMNSQNLHQPPIESN